jgi:hypothetical protein
MSRRRLEPLKDQVQIHELCRAAMAALTASTSKKGVEFAARPAASAIPAW